MGKEQRGAVDFWGKQREDGEWGLGLAKLYPVPSVPSTNQELRMPKSQVQLNMEEFFRRAHATEGGLQIPCGNKANAIRTRYMLYNAVKWVKDPKPGESPDTPLLEAVMGCEVSITGPGKDVVHVRRKIDNPAMRAILGAIGGNAVDPEKEAMAAATARLLKVQEELDAGKVPSTGAGRDFVYNPPWVKGKVGGGGEGNAE